MCKGKGAEVDSLGEEQRQTAQIKGRWLKKQTAPKKVDSLKAKADCLGKSDHPIERQAAQKVKVDSPEKESQTS